MNPPPTVYIVDDEDAVRKALRLMMSTAGYQVEDFASAAEFLNAYNPTKIGCLILDVRMPGMDGFALLRQLNEQRVRLPIIMLSAHGDIPMAVDAVKRGAVDFLEKPARASVLREKVAAALDTAERWKRQQRERQEILARFSTLTPREREVAKLLPEGKSNNSIAKALGMSENTLRVHRHNIREKMQADHATELQKMLTDIQGEISE